MIFPSSIKVLWTTSTGVRCIALIAVAGLLSGAILGCGTETDQGPTSDVKATTDVAVKATTPADTPTFEPTPTVAMVITSGPLAAVSEGPTDQVFWELNNSSTGRDLAALLTSYETKCLDARMGDDYQRFLGSPLAGNTADLLTGDGSALSPVESCLSGDRLAAARVSMLSVAAGGFSVETQRCITELLETDPALTKALTQPGDVSGGPSALRLLSCLTPEESASLTPPGDGPAPNPEEIRCLMDELAGMLAGERIIAVLSGSDPTGKGLTMEESAALGVAVETCGIETEFGFPAPGDTENQRLPSYDLRPVALGVPQEFFSQLSSAEQSCLSESGISPEDLLILTEPPPGGPLEITTGIVDCLHTDTVLRLFLTQIMGLRPAEPYSPNTSSCIREGFAPMDLRALLTPAVIGQGPYNSLELSMAALSVSVECMDNAEWQIMAPMLAMQVQDREKFGCMVDQLGGPAQLAAEMRDASFGAPPPAFIKAGEVCGLEVAGPTENGPTTDRGSTRTIVDPGPGTEYLGPQLWGFLQRHVDGFPVPPEIIIAIGHTEIGEEPAIGDFIESLGSMRVAPHTWEVPSDKVLLVVQRPDVISVQIIPYTPSPTLEAGRDSMTFAAISSGRLHTYSLREDGSGVCWGNNRTVIYP